MKNQGFIKNSAQPSTSGNVMVIILIMIALLAAVTITITRMGNNTTEVSQEEASVIASQVLRQAKTMANAVDGLVAKGCSITQLSFDNSTVTGYTNAQSPSDKSCWLFDASGAGLSFPTPPKSANDGTEWMFTRHNNVGGVGTERETGIACISACEDLLMVLPFTDVNVCKAINMSAGVTTSFSTAPPQNAGTGGIDLSLKFYAPNTAQSSHNYSHWTSSQAGFSIKTSVTPLNTNALWDKKTGCVEATSGYKDTSAVDQPGTGKYFFYHVLVER